MVRHSPSSRFTANANARFSAASEISGFRCRGVIPIHHPHHPIDQIIHEAKTPGLGPVPEHRDVLTLEHLNNEIAHYPAVVGMHARAVGVKDTDHPDIEFLMMPICF